MCKSEPETEISYFRVDGFIDWVPREADGTRQIIFLACGTCKHKVVDEGYGLYCETCQDNVNEGIPTYCFSARMSDYSGSEYIQFMGEIAETVIGMPAEDLYSII